MFYFLSPSFPKQATKAIVAIAAVKIKLTVRGCSKTKLNTNANVAQITTKIA